METEGLTEREALRADWVRRVPGWYSPWAHLAFTSGVGLGLAILALASTRGLRPWQLLFIPLVWLFSNATEWRAHRDLLHREQRWARPLFVQHTVQHHRLYRTDDMAIRSSRELRMVLIPAFGILLIFAITLPVAALLWAVGQPNLAALWIATTMGYVVSYEWLHLSYHLPPHGPLGGSRLLRRLGRHHAVHHAPERMQRWNLNVTVPLCDLLFGTLYREERADPAVERTAP